MLLTAGERISMALLCDGGRGSRRARGVVHRVAGRHRHRHRARPGQDHRGHGRPHPRGARRRARSRSSPASRACRPTREITTLGPRRLRHHRGRARRRARRRRVRDLHRRRRRVHRRPAHRAPTRASSRAVSFDEMLEMAATGGRVLALRSVEFARNHDVQVHVRSSFTWAPGTWVTEEDAGDGPVDRWSRRSSRASRTTSSEAKVTIEQVPDRPGVAATVFRAPRRRGRQRRHDRAERVDRGPHRHLVHRAARRPRRGPLT